MIGLNMQYYTRRCISLL